MWKYNPSAPTYAVLMFPWVKRGVLRFEKSSRSRDLQKTVKCRNRAVDGLHSQVKRSANSTRTFILVLGNVSKQRAMQPGFVSSPSTAIQFLKETRVFEQRNPRWVSRLSSLVDLAVEDAAHAEKRAAIWQDRRPACTPRLNYSPRTLREKIAPRDACFAINKNRRAEVGRVEHFSPGLRHASLTRQ